MCALKILSTSHNEREDIMTTSQRIRKLFLRAVNRINNSCSTYANVYSSSNGNKGNAQNYLTNYSSYIEHGTQNNPQKTNVGCFY